MKVLQILTLISLASCCSLNIKDKAYIKLTATKNGTLIRDGKNANLDSTEFKKSGYDGLLIAMPKGTTLKNRKVVVGEVFSGEIIEDIEAQKDFYLYVDRKGFEDNSFTSAYISQDGQKFKKWFFAVKTGSDFKVKEGKLFGFLEISYKN